MPAAYVFLLLLPKLTFFIKIVSENREICSRSRNSSTELHILGRLATSHVTNTIVMLFLEQQWLGVYLYKV